MLRPIANLNEYRYIIQDIIISKSGSQKQYIIPADFITSVSIINKYEENIIPIINVKASVSKEIYKLLTSSGGDLTLKISLYKYIINSQVKAKELVFNKNFSILNESDMQPDEVKMDDTQIDDKASNTSQNFNTNQTVESSFYLIDKNNLEKYRKIKSYSLVSASLTDTIALLFSDRGYSSLIMNSIPSDTIGRKFIPAYNLLSSLEYLNNKYGIFDTRYIFYMDIINTYLIDKKNLGKATVKGKPSNVALYLEEHIDDGKPIVGSIINQGIYVVNLTAYPTVINLSNYKEYMEGSNIHFVVKGKNISKLAGPKGSLDKAMNVLNNKIPKQVQFEQLESKTLLNTSLTDIDIDLLSPNLLFTIFANKQIQSINDIKGNYRLTDCNIILTKKGSDGEFALQSTVSLRRIK